jgi:hypothetical protein
VITIFDPYRQQDPEPRFWNPSGCVRSTIEGTKQAGAEPSFVPLGHYAHPDDPSKRTALCGEPILGVPSFGMFDVCVRFQILFEAEDWEPIRPSAYSGA